MEGCGCCCRLLLPIACCFLLRLQNCSEHILFHNHICKRKSRRPPAGPPLKADDSLPPGLTIRSKALAFRHDGRRRNCRLLLPIACCVLLRLQNCSEHILVSSQICKRKNRHPPAGRPLKGDGSLPPGLSDRRRSHFVMTAAAATATTAAAARPKVSIAGHCSINFGSMLGSILKAFQLM